MFATRAAFQAFRPTLRMMRLPKEEQAAHTVTQRLARLRKIPPELFPLGIVVGFAVLAAGYSSIRHFTVDKTIRLKRQNRLADNAHHDAHGEHAEETPAAEAK